MVRQSQEKANALSGKIITILIGVLIAIGGWFGNICYTKLTIIEADTKLILIANASQQMKLDDLKEQVKQHIEHHPGPSPENGGANHADNYPNAPRPKGQNYGLLTEFILPHRIEEDTTAEHEKS